MELKCQFCGTINNVIRYRQRTEYQDEELNYVTVCPECKAMNDEYWDSMWADYYSMVIDKGTL